MHVLRVVALATNIPGPLAAERLCAAGAAVTKVEPLSGDPLAEAAPQWYARIVRGMRVERLDLKRDDALARVMTLLENADVFITAVRPRALARRGLDFESLAQRFAQLCYIAVVGESGAASDRAGHDLTYQARAGLLTPPAHPRTVFADMFAAERAVAAAYELLYQREQTGRGGFREVAIAGGATQLNDASRFGLTSAHGPLGGSLSTYRLYRTADGWIAVAALEPHFQKQLRDALGVVTLQAGELERVFAAHENAHWERLAAERDLPLATVP